MNLIRSIISVFLVVLAALSVGGWIWAGGQPMANPAGARFALAMCGLASVAALGLLWREREMQRV